MKLATATNHLNTNNFYQQQKDWELEKTSVSIDKRFTFFLFFFYL